MAATAGRPDCAATVCPRRSGTTALPSPTPKAYEQGCRSYASPSPSASRTACTRTGPEGERRAGPAAGGPPRPNRPNLDRLVAAGAAVWEQVEQGGHLDHVVMADPEGNEYCVV
ncbi:MAG: VOC family protein [Mycobacteriales bacterium]